ncbi:acyltransferase family protein [Xylophilus rhododendri]|uniref:Acyltransferase family protein n=1 Tax=Xylophilus rhododendri TaxID=2697032 RepID=A0A857JDL3_9BURK|nr:acyltransferase [Xylophilus rhododendri]QHJ01200.1 acyltransferase family protein [Xylophilus rhododendri]
MKTPAARLPLIDSLKGLACCLIVWHHLAFYGPMSEVARPLAPWLMDVLADYARMAVQIFLVIGGFLNARSLAPRGTGRIEAPLARIGKRYLRLAMPYLVALATGMVAAMLARPWLPGPVVPAAPHEAQLLAHGFFLQDLVGQEALSAGVWYVAIDFQLFAATVLLFFAAQRWSSRPALTVFCLVSGIAAVSLVVFNRLPALDPTALYFFGAYGLGILACWGAHSPRPGRWMAGIALLGGVALAVDFRARIAIALAAALLLLWAHARHRQGDAEPALLRPLAGVGRISYSVFLIHFPVLLCVGALVHHLWPALPWANAAGMASVFGLSLLAGLLLHRTVESRGAGPGRLLLVMVSLLCLGAFLD